MSPAPSGEPPASTGRPEVLSEPPPTAVELFGDRLDVASRYAHSLATVGVERGLIGPREVARLWERHLVNSALVTRLPQRWLPPAAAVCDVGSGAGLPGIPMALVRPDLEMVLLEPLQRRADYLREVVAELGLDNVRVVRGRAEESLTVAAVGPVDVVVSRAVAALDRLLRWCAPLSRAGDRILAVKGANAEREVDQLPPAVRRLVDSVEVLTCTSDGDRTGTGESVTVVAAVRRAETKRRPARDRRS